MTYLVLPEGDVPAMTLVAQGLYAYEEETRANQEARERATDTKKAIVVYKLSVVSYFAP